MKKKIKIVSQILFAIATGYTLWHVQNFALEHTWSRYYNITLVAAALVACAIETSKKFHFLQSIPAGPKRNKEIAHYKFNSELAAAFSLIAFAIPYYQSGLELDRADYSARSKTYHEAHQIISKELSSEFCNEFPYRPPNCKAINSMLDQVITGIGKQDERAIHTLVDSIVFRLENTLGIKPNSLQEIKIQNATTLLKSVDLSEERISRFLIAIPMLILVSAVIAVSRKVAVAWDDHVRNKNIWLAETEKEDKCGRRIHKN